MGRITALVLVMALFWICSPAKAFWLVGHRGVRALEDENTIAALDAGLAHGANALECDVRATSDQALVIMHDARVDRTTNGRGKVRSFTLPEFQALSTPRGHHPPTLAEVLARYRDREITLFLEIKEPAPELVAPLAALLEANRGRARIIVFAIDADFLVRLKSRLPWVKVFLAPLEPFTAVAKARRLGLDGLLVADFFASRALVRSAHAQGLPVVVSMTDYAWEVRRALRFGVDGVLVNDPAHAPPDLISSPRR